MKQNCIKQVRPICAALINDEWGYGFFFPDLLFFSQNDKIRSGLRTKVKPISQDPVVAFARNTGICNTVFNEGGIL